LDNYVAPEIPSYAQSIVKVVIGTKAEVKSVEWTAGGLYNKVFYVHTSEGCFILKIECDKIFPSTRIGQMENEVEGSRLVRQAGIKSPKILAHDFTGRDVGVRYIFAERVSGDIVWVEWGQMSDATKADVDDQSKEIISRMSEITNDYFGSLTSSGPLGWHKTWDECYRIWFDLLIRDSVEINLFTDEELAVVKVAAEKPLEYSKIHIPTFEHGDFGRHNIILGHINNEPDALHVIDFGNARYLPPHLGVGTNPFDVPDAQNLDSGINLLLLCNFEMGVMWKETAKMTEDYAHCTNGLTSYIESSKKDTSRTHITDFVDKCRKIL